MTYHSSTIPDVRALVTRLVKDRDMLRTILDRFIRKGDTSTISSITGDGIHLLLSEMERDLESLQEAIGMKPAA